MHYLLFNWYQYPQECFKTTIQYFFSIIRAKTQPHVSCANTSTFHEFNNPNEFSFFTYFPIHVFLYQNTMCQYNYIVVHVNKFIISPESNMFNYLPINEILYTQTLRTTQSNIPLDSVHMVIWNQINPTMNDKYKVNECLLFVVKSSFMRSFNTWGLIYINCQKYFNVFADINQF